MIRGRKTGGAGPGFFLPPACGARFVKYRQPCAPLAVTRGQFCGVRYRMGRREKTELIRKKFLTMVVRRVYSRHNTSRLPVFLAENDWS